MLVLEKSPERYVDQCVKTRGFSNGFGLASTAAELHNPSKDPAPNIEVNWKNEAVPKRLRSSPSFVNVVGRVRSCAREDEMMEKSVSLRAKLDHTTPGEIMITGACHTAVFAIFASQATVVPTAMD